MVDRNRWVLLAYRLPREPSTPRITLWRRLRQLGAAQIVDNLVALPLDDHTREQVQWLADEVAEAGGEASVWLSEPDTSAAGHAMAAALIAARAAEYQAIVATAERAAAEDSAGRRRTLHRLRRELRRIRARDYFAVAERLTAEAAVEQLAALTEVTR